MFNMVIPVSCVYVIIALTLIYFIFQWQKAKTILYALMLQAKRYAKDMILESGQEQEDWVVEKAMLFLPFSIRIFLSEKVIRKIVKKLFIALKAYVQNETDSQTLK